jgi:hypothetical protein
VPRIGRARPVEAYTQILRVTVSSAPVTIELSVATLTVAAPALTATVDPQLDATTITVAAPALEVGPATVTLSVATVAVAAPALEGAAGPVALSVNNITVATPAVSFAYGSALSAANLNIAAPALAVSSGPVSLALTTVAIGTPALAPAVALPLSVALVTVAAPALGPASGPIALTDTTVSIAAPAFTIPHTAALSAAGVIIAAPAAAFNVTVALTALNITTAAPAVTPIKSIFVALPTVSVGIAVEPVKYSRVLYVSLAARSGVDDYGNDYPAGVSASVGAIPGTLLNAASVPASAVDFTAASIGGVNTYVQGTAPSGSINAGSLWIDTSAGNALYQYESGSWSLYQFGTGSIAANSISATQIAANTITASQIAAGAISTAELAAGAVTAAKITSNTITATQIAANTITASQLAAGIVYAGIVNSTTISTATINASTFNGPEMIINQYGAFFYSSTPAAGNLIATITGTGGTDTEGNAYLAGNTTYYDGTLAIQTYITQITVYTASSYAGPWTASDTVITMNTSTINLMAESVVMSGEASVASSFTVEGGLLVEEASTFEGDVTMDVNLNVTDAINCNTLGVASTATFDAGVGIAGSLGVTGGLTVASGATFEGDVTMDVNLNVTDAINCNTLGVDGTAIVPSQSVSGWPLSGNPAVTTTGLGLSNGMQTALNSLYDALVAAGIVS